MTNGPPGDYWHEHLSADEFYILPVLTAFAVAYAFLQMAVVICSIELKSRHMLHATYKIYSFSVVMHLIGVLIELIAYIKYATTGLDTQKVKRAGAVLLGASETSFLLLLLLLAKGYTTTRGRLPIGTSVKLTVFMCIYSVTYTAIFIYEAKVFDPGEVLYQFESPAGYELIALRIIAWIVFISSTVFTLKLISRLIFIIRSISAVRYGSSRDQRSFYRQTLTSTNGYGNPSCAPSCNLYPSGDTSAF